jgi:hypothetical protein
MGRLFSVSAKRIVSLLLLFLLIFLLGAFSSLQDTKGGRSWVLAVRDRIIVATPTLPLGLKDNLSQLLGVEEIVFPDTTQTLRYDILVKRRYDLEIEGQLAQDNRGSTFKTCHV